MTDYVLPKGFENGEVAEPFRDGFEMESGTEGIEASYPVIKILGKVWSLQYRGNNYPFMQTEGDEAGNPIGTLRVCFLKLAKTKAKTYYPGGYKQGSRDKPMCWSSDAVKPDLTVPPDTRQSDLCATCPQNKVGSKITDDGKAIRACADHKRVAVYIDPKMTEKLLGFPLSEPALLRIPAASLNEFHNWSAFMERAKYRLITFITKIRFDPSVPYQKFLFEASDKLTAAEAALAIELRESPMAQRIIGDASGGGDEHYALPGPAPDESNVVKLNPAQKAIAPPGTRINPNINKANPTVPDLVPAGGAIDAEIDGLMG